MVRLKTDQTPIVKFRTWWNVGIALILLHAVCLPVAWAEEPTPEILIKQVINTYRSLETYRVTGHTDTEITDFHQGGKVSHLTHRFTILLKKPNAYQIIWEDDVPPYSRANQIVAWNAGTQAYAYSQSAEGYMKVHTDLLNLKSHYGISTRTTSVISELFFAFFPEKDLRISRLNHPAVKGREEIEGDECYVLEGRDRNIEVTYWISVGNFFIRRVSLFIHHPNGPEPDFVNTEEEAKASLRAHGWEPTRERIENFIQTVEIATNIMKKQRSQLITTHHFTDISLPTVTDKDLEFTVPEGITLKENMYELSQSALDDLEDSQDAMEK